MSRGQLTDSYPKPWKLNVEFSPCIARNNEVCVCVCVCVCNNVLFFCFTMIDLPFRVPARSRWSIWTSSERVSYLRQTEYGQPSPQVCWTVMLLQVSVPWGSWWLWAVLGIGVHRKLLWSLAGNGRSVALCFPPPHPSYLILAWKLLKIFTGWVISFTVSPKENRNFLYITCTILTGIWEKGRF